MPRRAIPLPCILSTSARLSVQNSDTRSLLPSRRRWWWCWQSHQHIWNACLHPTRRQRCCWIIINSFSVESFWLKEFSATVRFGVCWWFRSVSDSVNGHMLATVECSHFERCPVRIHIVGTAISGGIDHFSQFLAPSFLKVIDMVKQYVSKQEGPRFLAVNEKVLPKIIYIKLKKKIAFGGWIWYVGKMPL